MSQDGWQVPGKVSHPPLAGLSERVRVVSIVPTAVLFTQRVALPLTSVTLKLSTAVCMENKGRQEQNEPAVVVEKEKEEVEEEDERERAMGGKLFSDCFLRSAETRRDRWIRGALLVGCPYHHHIHDTCQRVCSAIVPTFTGVKYPPAGEVTTVSYSSRSNGSNCRSDRQ
jgi:hypothetical protein